MDVNNRGLCLASSIEQYASGYTGYTLTRRLHHIVVVSPQYRNDAMRYLFLVLKQGINTSLYRKVFKDMELEAQSVEPSGPDINWMNATDQAASARLETLEQELNSARSMISKEGIRKAYSNIGDYFYEHGDLEEAMKSYYRCRDFCTMPWHLDEMYENVFNVSADLDEFAAVGFSSQTKSKQEEGSSVSIRPFSLERRQISGAMIALRQKDYSGSARALLELNSFNESIFPSLLSSQDISVYGTVLAVATLNRDELRRMASSGHPFRQYIEIVPCMMRFLVDFLERRYLAVIETCRMLEQQFQFDIIFSRHLTSIIALIIDKVFTQYVEPYEAVDISKMASGLSMTCKGVIIHLSDLIASGKIQAKLDTVSMTMRRTKLNHQDVAMKRVIRLTDEHSVNSQRALLRLRMLQNGISEDNQNESDA